MIKSRLQIILKEQLTLSFFWLNTKSSVSWLPPVFQLILLAIQIELNASISRGPVPS